MRDYLGYLCAGDTILFRLAQVVIQGVVGYALTDKRGERYETTVAEREQVVSASYFAKQNIIVQMCKFGSKLPQPSATGSLYYFLLCHSRYGN